MNSELYCSLVPVVLLSNVFYSLLSNPVGSAHFPPPLLRTSYFTRAGLDRTTLRLVAAYESIIYISCSPDSLTRDLTQVRDII